MIKLIAIGVLKGGKLEYQLICPKCGKKVIAQEGKAVHCPHCLHLINFERRIE